MKFIFLFLISAFVSFSQSFPVDIKGPEVLKGSVLNVTTKDQKALVVVFLSAKCPCSNSHVKELITLSNEYPEYKFLGIHSNVDENTELTKNYFSRVNLPFPVLQDEKAKWADEFKATKTPHAFVLNSEGVALYKGGVSSSQDFGQAEHAYLREALEDIKKNRNVRTPNGRTLGCAISRGEQNVW